MFGSIFRQLAELISQLQHQLPKHTQQRCEKKSSSYFCNTPVPPISMLTMGLYTSCEIISPKTTLKPDTTTLPVNIEIGGAGGRRQTWKGSIKYLVAKLFPATVPSRLYLMVSKHPGNHFFFCRSMQINDSIQDLCPLKIKHDLDHFLVTHLCRSCSKWGKHGWV